MRSSGRQPPLNFSAAVLSSLSSSSSSSSGSQPLTSFVPSAFRPVCHIYSSASFSFTSSVSSSSSLSSSSSRSSLVATLFRLLFFLVLASLATGLDSSSVSGSVLAANSPNRAVTEGNSSLSFAINDSQPQGEMPQKDEPPRPVSKISQTPGEWSKQPQDRYFYLMAENEQYLQLHGSNITGTTMSRPPLGIMKFISHEMHIIIQSIHSLLHLCMNKHAKLYLSASLNDECYIMESSLNDSHALTYTFVRYSSEESPRLLGIDCDPLLGDEANRNPKAYRFIPDAIPGKEAETLKKRIDAGKGLKVADKCLPKPMKVYPRVVQQAKRRKLRTRWCWNLNRIIHDRKKYWNNCLERHPRKCKINMINSRECVCSILKRMMDHPRRAKRKCLMQSISTRIKKGNEQPDPQKVRELAQYLIKKNIYNDIARRMRYTKRDQQKKEKRKPKHRKRHKTVKLGQMVDNHKSELILRSIPSSISPGQVDGSAPALSDALLRRIVTSGGGHRVRRRRKKKTRRQRHRSSSEGLDVQS